MRRGAVAGALRVLCASLEACGLAVLLVTLGYNPLLHIALLRSLVLCLACEMLHIECDVYTHAKNAVRYTFLLQQRATALVSGALIVRECLFVSYIITRRKGRLYVAVLIAILVIYCKTLCEALIHLAHNIKQLHAMLLLHLYFALRDSKHIGRLRVVESVHF